MPNKQSLRRTKSKRPKKIRIIWQVQLAVVVALVIGLGLRAQLGSKAFSGNHAHCNEQDANGNNLNVTTGSIFAGTVRMNNNGTTTWYPSFGVYLEDTTNLWNYQGNTLSRNIAPGDTAVFNLTLHAPTTAGKYSYVSSMGIISLGTFADACPSKTIAVIGKPVTTITGPGNGSSVSGTSVTITANAISPNGAGSITKVNFYAGNTLVGSDTGSPYSVIWNTKDGRFPNGNYTLKSQAFDNINQNSYSGSSTTVNVNNTSPSPSPSPAPSGSGSSSSASRSSGSRTGSAPAVPDTTPPSIPTGFTAQNNDADKSINLTWDGATDNVGVQGYTLDRSDNGQDWTELSSSITSTTYEDTTVGFGTAYHYRLRAFDAANNFSDYALADSSNTSSFQANVDPSSDATITSEDQTYTIKIPAGALDKPAFCVIALSTSRDPPQFDRYKVVAGPFDLTCRDAGGTVLGNFATNMSLDIQLKKVNTAGVSTLTYYSYADNQWSPIKQTAKIGRDRIAHFDLGTNASFVIMGKIKTTSTLKVVITIILGLVGLTVVVLFVLRFLLRRKYQNQYNDYMRKIRGG